ncbi:Sigma-70 family RNA polymerase sigma factor [Flavobacterium longum]|uniref:RNA polymerase sigma factor n=1 Tax=Flavobacterium longum TaxID=1299340 RepID=UPI0039E7E9D6
MSLDQLIHDCKNNDTKAQEQLYRLFSSKLFAICLKYSRNYAEAEDNLQDGFLIVFDKIHQYNFKGSFEGWIKRIMINNILQQYRKVSFLELTHENIADEPEVEIDETVSLDFLMKIIQELPDRYRLVFNLYVIDGYSHNDIADMLDISTGTSKSNLSRARVILKEKIESHTAQNNLPSAR